MSGAVRFNLAAGEKFGALVLSGAHHRSDLAPEVHLGKDEWLLAGPPLQLQEHWQRWLGEIRARAIAESNLWLISKNHSSSPVERNKETKELEYRAQILGAALMLTTPLAYQSGFVLGGANVDGTLEVHEFADLRPSYRYSLGERHTSIGAAQITQLVGVIAGLDQILPAQELKRVAHGISTFLRALRREYSDARLHQLVRSLEGVIKPAIGASRRHFVHRGQTFTGASQNVEEILSECFDIRSQVEHLHDWQGALAHVPPDHREDRLLLHVRRMETLSRSVYTRICTSPQHRDLLRDDAIDAFWKRPDHERTTLWGTPVDLAGVK